MVKNNFNTISLNDTSSESSNHSPPIVNNNNKNCKTTTKIASQKKPLERLNISVDYQLTTGVNYKDKHSPAAGLAKIHSYDYDVINSLNPQISPKVQNKSNSPEF